MKLVDGNCAGRSFTDCLLTDNSKQYGFTSKVDVINDSGSTINGGAVYENLTGKLVSDKGSQTLYSKFELSAKVETMILMNEVSTTKLQAPKLISTLSYENIVREPHLMKHFTGLTPPQLEVLHDFLDDVCPLESINYWTSKDCPATENAKTGPKTYFSSREKLFICLLRLRRGFTLKTLAALLSAVDRNIDQSYVRKKTTLKKKHS